MPISDITSINSSSVLDAQQTFAPAFAKPIAIARPIPLLAPVITATFPSNLSIANSS
jgi:hypothetical protein